MDAHKASGSLFTHRDEPTTQRFLIMYILRHPSLWHLFFTTKQLVQLWMLTAACMVISIGCLLLIYALTQTNALLVGG